ncbi:hypothetical protein ACFL5G_04315 [Candidatus Margulisiibacteriota bacterium]
MFGKRLILITLAVSITLSMSLGVAYADQDELAIDISRSGMGARPMALGKTFTGLADDTNAILYNPAGLAYFKQPKFMNINSQLLHDVRYATYLMAWPTEYGTFGLGQVNVGVQNIYIGEWTSPAETDTYVVGKATYATDVTLLTYAKPLDKQLSWGINLKYFRHQFANLGVEDSGASGTNIDVGLLYRVTPRLQYGLFLQNLITGPTLAWDNGEKEILESYCRLGMAYKMGRAGVFSKLNWLADLEVPVVANYKPMGIHLGVEAWFFDDIFALRLGTGTKELSHEGRMMNAFEGTIGLGLNLYGVNIDYTYASGALDLDDKGEKYFVSLAYHFPEKEEDEWDILPEPMELTIEPEKKYIADEVIIKKVGVQRPYPRAQTVKVETLVLNKNMVEVRDILGMLDYDLKNVYFSERGQMLKQVRLYPGENWLTYTMVDAEGEQQQYLKKVLVLVDPADVNSSTQGYAEIRALTMTGVLNGYQGNRGIYRPQEPADFGEMEFAVQMLKQNAYDLDGKPELTDVNMTRREAVLLLVNNFGGSIESYLKIFPAQVANDILAGKGGGELKRCEMAQLIILNQRAQERINKIAKEYNLPGFQIYSAMASSAN